MNLIDFSNHQNRLVRVTDVSPEYLAYIHQTAMEDEWYPAYHIAPPHGLLNDPNGLCQINGVYHIFYQWFPLGPVHGLKHWYHLTTTDFVHYEDHTYGMKPEDSFDLHGCYSGMCFQDQGKKHVYYTGIDEHDQANVCYGVLNQNKIEKKGVITSLDTSITSENFRDPCVWKSGEEYWMMVGGESPKHQGILPMYKGTSPDEFHYQGNLKLVDYPFGYMLECPNYYETEGKGVLFFSPQGIQSPNRYDFRNVFSVVYMIADPIKEIEFPATSFYEMDKGFDFYAPQIFKDEQGRHILYGWLGNSKCEYPSDKNNWAHMLTIPRSVSIDGDRLIQEPLKELEALRQDSIEVHDVLTLKDMAFEMEIQTDQIFEMRIENDKQEYVSFQMLEQEFQLDRSHMTYLYNEQYGNVRYAKRINSGMQTIRIFVDHSSIEIFADHGKTVFTGRFYLDQASKIVMQGASATLWKLKSNRVVNQTEK